MFFENSVHNYKFSICICGLVCDSIKNIQNLSKSRRIEDFVVLLCVIDINDCMRKNSLDNPSLFILKA